MRQGTSTEKADVFSVGHLLLACSLSFGVIFFSLRLPWRKLNYHLQVVINWRKLLGEGWGHVSTSFSFLTPSHEDLCRLYACCLGLYKFISASILLIYRLLFLWCAAAPLALALFPPSVLKVSTSPEG